MWIVTSSMSYNELYLRLRRELVSKGILTHFDVKVEALMLKNVDSAS